MTGEADKMETTTMAVVTIAPGANASGIVAVGSRLEVDPSMFSSVWMRPASSGDARKLEAWRKSKG